MSALSVSHHPLRSLPLVREARSLLSARLPQGLVYHSVEHSDQVVVDALRLAEAEGVAGRELELLAIAAAWHDAGFVVRIHANEPEGARLAVEAMQRNGGYTEEERRRVEQMITDTALLPRPQGGWERRRSSALSGYLLDADLANFGREDFFDKAELIRREFGASDLRAYLSDTLLLIEQHRWWTTIAHRLFEEQRLKNVDSLRQRIAALG